VKDYNGKGIRKTFLDFFVVSYLNRCIDFLREERRQGKHFLIFTKESDGSDYNVLEDCLFYISGPLEKLIEGENAEDVWRVLKMLSSRHREILGLAYFKNCSYVKISNMLGIPLGTVRSRLYQAKKSFEEKYFFTFPHTKILKNRSL